MEKTVKITTTFITLGQLLKVTKIINSGAEAKVFLKINNVLINQEKECRRGKKLYIKDKIFINDLIYVIT